MRKTKKSRGLVDCPRCEGVGEEPGAPVDMEYGNALCSCCKGTGRVVTPVTPKEIVAYEEELAGGA